MRLLKFPGALFLTFMVVLFLVTGIGKTAHNPVADMFSVASNGQVCWYGICPGQTQIYLTQQILRELGFTEVAGTASSCWHKDRIAHLPLYIVCVNKQKSLISEISVSYSQNISNGHEVPIDATNIGNLVTLLGEPIAFDKPICGTTQILFRGNLTATVAWTNFGGIGRSHLWRLDPNFSAIRAIAIGTKSKTSGRVFAWHWRGFIGTNTPGECLVY